MDANGLRFWMLADEADWVLAGEPPLVQYDAARRSLRLASERLLPPLSGAAGAAAEAEARSRLEQVPQARDRYGTRAYWDSTLGAVMADGAVEGAVAILYPPPGSTPADLALGYDGVLYLAIDGAVVMQDRRDRWLPVTLQAPAFTAWRLAADPSGGVWVLDRVHQKLARVRGLPLPDRPFAEYAPGTFRPCEENPDPPRLRVVETAVWPAEEEAVAIACSPEGCLAVLTWVTADARASARVRLLDPGDRIGPPTTLQGAPRPYSLAWVSQDEVAVLVPGLPSEAPVFRLSTATDGAPATALPSGDFYPLRDYDAAGSFGGPFAHGLDLPPHYPTRAASGPGPLAPLHHLSLPAYAASGTATNRRLLDSGSAQTVWHRLYLEASIPPHCGLRVYLAAGDTPVPPESPEEWYEHRFGGRFVVEPLAPRDSNGGSQAAVLNAPPRGAWVPFDSEVPFAPALLQCERKKDRAGLFTVLVQRATRRVRALRGRYLWVRVELLGDGRSTPELAALRAYGSRFSYVDHYLPELYRETVFGPDADRLLAADGPQTSTPADFLERFLDNFEGILTPLEDRIASAYLLTDPRTTPDEALEWLGGWIGVSFDPAYPPDRRRRLIEAAPQLFRRHGTLDGLRLALDVATGGGVSRGQIVILEDFRLRRTFATILGADLANEDDPLTAGLAVSGNSFVGDTLFLGDETGKEFLAVFGAGLPTSPAEAAAIEAFFDRLAYRVTVLVHEEVTPQDLGLIRRVVALESPAHVLARVVTASVPFMVGMASLVGVDTFLATKPEREAARLDESQVGVRDYLLGLPSLDPRLERDGSAAVWRGVERPVADAGPDRSVDEGAAFVLDGSRSWSPSGERLVRYRWTRLQ